LAVGSWQLAVVVVSCQFSVVCGDVSRQRQLAIRWET
jgi:hypothetical protein